MQIEQDTVVSFDYTLRNNDGEVLDTSEGREPLTYLHGHQNIVPGLEKAIEGAAEGEELSVSVSPEDGYGQYHEELVQTVPMDIFQGVEKVEPGMRFQAQSQAGPMLVTVKEVSDEEVVVDGNHELAGKDLNFEVAIRDIRKATEEEVSQGQVADQD